MILDTRRILRLMLAGAFAGLVIFIVFNPSAARDEERMMRVISGQIMDLDALMQALKDLQHQFTTPDPIGAFLFTGEFAAMVACLIAIVDEMSTRLKRVLRKVLVSTVGGLLIGGIIGVGIDSLGTCLARINLILFPLAQLFLFPLIGFAAGAAVALTLGSWRRARLAMLGGLIGGTVGGVVFQTIGSLTGLVVGTGSIGRFFGFVAMGAIIGLSVAFVEEAAKQSWVTVLNGPREGRHYILSKPTTTVGRDELADIPLFGDMSVAKDHVHLDLQGYMVTLRAAGGRVSVNGTDSQVAYLKPGDLIRVGRHDLRFHQRWEYRAAPQVHYQPYGAQQPYAYQQPRAHQQVFTAQQPHAGYVAPQTSAFPAVGMGTLALVVSSGPHVNERFQFPPGSFKIGRETNCGVFLPNDTLISRLHAELEWNGNQWMVRDLNSRHGLWVNGVRTMEHALNVGDQIGVGQTWLRVEGI